MPTPSTLLIFLGAALVLAALPGPGQFYIAGRTLAAGSADGMASCLGTALGGLVHVIAGAVGISALIMASATAFGVLSSWAAFTFFISDSRLGGPPTRSW